MQSESVFQVRFAETLSLDRPLAAALPVRSALDAYFAENGFTTDAYDAIRIA